MPSFPHRFHLHRAPIGRHAYAAVAFGLLGLAAVFGLIHTAAAWSDLPSPMEAQSVFSAFHEEHTAQTNAYPNCRFGVGGNVVGYDVAALNAGWHIDWSTQLDPPQPNGAEYGQMVRLMPHLLNGYSFSPMTDTLYLLMDQNPGSLWFIGNEPDSPFQDELAPEMYARAYQHVYHLIKTYDPTARIGVGGIVQATPLRFQYLDRVWNTYQQLYGERLPSDLWNIHSYILREIDAADPLAFPKGPFEVWGAYIPPGITATRGVLYTYSDMFSLAIFRQRLIDFRKWMRDHGERDKPLYITEYGELFPYPPDIAPPPYQDENGVNITSARVAAFMTGTFNILLNQTDDQVGYPADANRLVQRWIWYSLSDVNFGGALFDPNSHARRPLGDVYYAYTHAISPVVDLLAVSAAAEPATVPSQGQLMTTTLKATLSNIGNISVSHPITVTFYAGSPPSGTQIGSVKVMMSGLSGCGDKRVITATWRNRAIGAHPFFVRVQSNGETIDAIGVNNEASGIFLVAAHQIYLPIALR